MQWDVFSRVIDNHGDLGVCWRLAADLAARGEQVRLIADDASALRWMAPQGAEGVSLHGWDAPPDEPGDVVIEAFGCALPEPFTARMQRPKPPVWINLEYLSAEDYVERSHGLRSPQRSGLTKWFFYPGFSERTGGLLREPGLAARVAGFDAEAWLAAQGLRRRPGERVVSLFCYDNPALPDLLRSLADEPSLLLLTPGFATAQAEAALGPGLQLGSLRAHRLPWLTQSDYDHLLWCCDLNCVRGEDSFVRAQWAGAPFVWQIYPQHDGAHAAKLEAFLARFLAGAPPEFAAQLRSVWQAWNGLRATSSMALPHSRAWRAAAQRWRDTLWRQPDLATQLIGFVAEKG